MVLLIEASPSEKLVGGCMCVCGGLESVWPFELSHEIVFREEVVEKGFDRGSVGMNVSGLFWKRTGVNYNGEAAVCRRCGCRAVARTRDGVIGGRGLETSQAKRGRAHTSTLRAPCTLNRVEEPFLLTLWESL